ncbi:hypothetical protein AKO1_011839 [Acrasis kona]|uniref:Phenazine biosynthesis-like domain-containing protein 1 n=1 Tax=Acrasis kona TaxID=1008807 RepID=A0AAW2Z6Y3_9EUKA
MVCTEIFIADAFTKVAFNGNPAAVCLLKESIDEEKMKLIAREMNLSETAFITTSELSKESEVILNLRWFTPTVEVALCGHATLASAHILINEGYLSSLLPKSNNIQEIKFDTKSGRLGVTKSSDGRLTMDFPLGEPKKITLSTNTLDRLMSVLSVGDRACVKNVALCRVTKKLLVEVDNYQSVIRAKANKDLMNIDFECNDVNLHVRGIILTTADAPHHHDQRYDFCSRYFSPWNGIAEDPVNGSGHTVQGVYYSNMLNKKDLVAYQASDRTGVLYLTLSENRILMSGYAKTVLKGSINI